MMFADRAEAGRALADRLATFEDGRVVVLALPRGGVPVAAEVARALGAPMDVIGVRKLGAPMQPELAMGAIAEGGVRELDDRTVQMLRIDAAAIDAIEAREREELERRVREYRGDRGLPELRGRTVIVVDDGLATGSTARVACRAVRQRGPERLILAVPVASREGLSSLQHEADEVVCVEAPPDFLAVGQWYRDFGQTTDDEVRRLLTEIGAPQGEDP
jgi:putative phosphoribosyl transferase